MRRRIWEVLNLYLRTERRILVIVSLVRAQCCAAIVVSDWPAACYGRNNYIMRPHKLCPQCCTVTIVIHFGFIFVCRPASASRRSSNYRSVRHFAFVCGIFLGQHKFLWATFELNCIAENRCAKLCRSVDRLANGFGSRQPARMLVATLFLVHNMRILYSLAIRFWLYHPHKADQIHYNKYDSVMRQRQFMGKLCQCLRIMHFITSSARLTSKLFRSRANADHDCARSAPPQQHSAAEPSKRHQLLSARAYVHAIQSVRLFGWGHAWRWMGNAAHWMRVCSSCRFRWHRRSRRHRWRAAYGGYMTNAHAVVTRWPMITAHIMQ